MIHIIGAGMAGLLAGRVLQHRRPEIFEAQPSLPNNHSAVLRFRSSVVGDTLNIPFRKVSMIKTTVPWRNPVADALAYSFKNTGMFLSDRSINSYELINVDRYIAPSDLIAQMADGCRIHYSAAFTYQDIVDYSLPFISTMPMPALMELLSYPHRNQITFNYNPGVNVRAALHHCDAYVTVMAPDPHLPFSRVSITGNEIIVESHSVTGELTYQRLHKALELLGMVPNDVIPETVSEKSSKYHKIIAIDEELRRHFLHWATVTHNVYSLGRFATWRPGLLLDDLIKDIRLIDKWAFSSNKYEIKKAS